jgi:hypothetical protein
MNRDHRMLRRVRKNMHELGAYMHRLESDIVPPRDTAPTPRERLVYEGQVAINFFEADQGFITLANVTDPDDLGAAIAIMLGAEREGEWLPDIDVKARIIVEILE